MLVTIPDLLDSTRLAALTSVLRQGEYVDGKLSAGKHARGNKNNQELNPSAETFDALNNVVMTSLVQHPLYLQYAMPARICAPIYARYTSGMGYGGHIDDPVMGPANARYRSDISISIFLNSPDEYDGGELCIESSQGMTEVKLPAGQAVMYPSTSFHSVRQVSAGERLVAVTWVQSYIRRADQREILVQLDQARQMLAQENDHPAFSRVETSYANLFRMWAEV